MSPFLVVKLCSMAFKPGETDKDAAVLKK